MKPLLYPDWLDDIWAKSPDKGEGGKAESLAQHTWAVLSRLAEFIHLRPYLPEQLGREDLWHLLYWSAFFHDLGKAMPAFQNVLHGYPDAKKVWQGNRHEVFSLAFLRWTEPGLPKEQLLWIATAIVSHHRDLDEIFQLYPRLDEEEEDPLSPYLVNLETITLEGIKRWIKEYSSDWILELKLDHHGIQPIDIATEPIDIEHSGAQFIRTYLKAVRKFYRSLSDQEQSFLVRGLTLRGHLINADHGGSAHVETLHIVDFNADDILKDRGIKYSNLYDHQRNSGETRGSALLTAPTGSGKTEAALLWAAKQRIHGLSAPRLFYTLPYQASMNAMFTRLQGSFGDKNVALQHGRGILALYRKLMERGYTSEDAARNAKLMRNLAQLNHPPVRVFSPYQMLKGMYRLKGYEAQLSDYHDALFIFDEIHAYEVKRLAMILGSINYLWKHFNSRFFIMSATFPTLIKDWLREALNDPIEIKAEPELFQKFQRHQLRVIEDDLLTYEWLERIAGEVRLGKSVLVVCNTVSRAQSAYAILKELLKAPTISVILLHGRFNLRDRIEKEKAIQSLAATRNEKRSPILLVATQVVEVSLDIDLNTIYTDPAPLEALVQRFGRINRGLKLSTLATVNVFTYPEGGQKIYNTDLIEKSLQILRRENGHPINEVAIGTWLDEIYNGPIKQKWQTEFTQASNEFNDICLNTLCPFSSDDSLEREFYKAFDGIDVLPEAFVEKYQHIQEEDPILANELCVSISWGRYHALLSQGKVIPGDRSFPPVIKTSYSHELGLTFEKQTQTDEWE